ncbi:uncharacterized protein LOC119454155 [Dermacentor silvarum]|uniref:uncharacterized protein LOC119454155 n=1 Tax=Dermacentor silvarum TaxID=543639 RepID=UPI0021015A37|nr:uncharacterized protein LOC119454155 [Dermacentor silvarum]
MAAPDDPRKGVIRGVDLDIDPSPSEEHDCKATCKLCGGAHDTADTKCKQRFLIPYVVSHRRRERQKQDSFRDFRQEYDGEKKASRHYAWASQGVPVLAIVYYLQRKYAHNSELYPECIEQRTRVDQILYSVACSIRPHHITFFHRRFGDNSKPTEEEQADFEEKVLGGIQCLIGQGPFAAGDTLTVAVLSILAFLALSLDIDYVNSVRFPDLFEYCERVKGALSYFDDVYGSTIRLYRRIWAQLQ